MFTLKSSYLEHLLGLAILIKHCVCTNKCKVSLRQSFSRLPTTLTRRGILLLIEPFADKNNDEDDQNQDQDGVLITATRPNSQLLLVSRGRGSRGERGRRSHRLSISPDNSAPVLEKARGRPPLSDEDKERRRLALEEGKAARKAE